MSLLQKASIITTPTAYAEDYLYSIKPALSLGAEEITNGNFSVSGTINATSFSLGFASSDTGGTFTISNQQVTLARVNGSTRLRGTNGVDSLNFLTSGKKYRLVYNVISNNGASAFYYYNGSTGVAAPSTVGQHTIDYTSAGTQFYLETQNNGSNITLDGISIKEVTDADFDFDRNSTGTRVNEDYLIEDVPYNLATYSEDFSTAWSFDDCTATNNSAISPDGTLTAALFKGNTNNSAHSMNKSPSPSQSVTGTISLFAKAKELKHIQIVMANTAHQYVNFDVSNGTIGTIGSDFTNVKIESAGNGWYRLSATSLNRFNGIYINLVSGLTAPWLESWSMTNNTDGLYIWGVQLVKGDQPKDYLKTTDRLDIPRIDYTNGEPSILLEPSRTNLVPYSNDFSNSAWTKSASTINSNAIISPDGTSNAVKLVENSANTEHAIFDNVITSTGDFSISIMVKASERSRVRVSNGSNSHRADFDLSNGNISNKVSVTADMISMPNDWYLCKISYNISSTAAQYMFLSLIDNSGNVSYQGDGSSGVYIYGAQLEAGSYATSLIHTSGSAVTRSADAANNAGNSDLINSTEGVLYAEFKGQNDNTFNYISVSDGGTTNYAAILCSDVDNEIAYRYYVSNSGVQIVTSVSNLLEFNKIAVKWKVNDFSIYINGVQVGASTSGSVNSAGTLNNVSFARGTSNNTPFYGNFKSVMVFKEALTDLELEKLTGYNNHELYMNYYNRLSYLGLAEEYNVESDINNYIL